MVGRVLTLELAHALKGRYCRDRDPVLRGLCV